MSTNGAETIEFAQTKPPSGEGIPAFRRFDRGSGGWSPRNFGLAQILFMLNELAPFAVAHSIFLLRLAPYDRGDIILAHNALLVGFKESVELPVLVNIHLLAVGENEGVARDCITYHPYMRDKIVLTRILRMTDIDPTSLVSTN